MSRKFKLEKNYYDNGVDLYKKKTVTIKPGVTVLVGCNGIGKTTLMRQMESQLKKQKIPHMKYDNYEDGGHKSISSNAFFEDFGFVATAVQSSEGENIVMNMVRLSSRIGQFVKTALDNDKSIKLTKAIENIFKKDEDKENKIEIPAERWIFLDAIDSGMSVDNIVDIKEYLFKTIFKNNYGNEIYIIVSANEYEMARNEQCFDVYNGNYITFNDYEEYRKFILESKEWKNQRENEK